MSTRSQPAQRSPSPTAATRRRQAGGRRRRRRPPARIRPRRHRSTLGSQQAEAEGGGHPTGIGRGEFIVIDAAGAFVMEPRPHGARRPTSSSRLTCRGGNVPVSAACGQWRQPAIEAGQPPQMDGAADRVFGVRAAIFDHVGTGEPGFIPAADRHTIGQRGGCGQEQVRREKRSVRRAPEGLLCLRHPDSEAIAATQGAAEGDSPIFVGRKFGQSLW